MIAGVFEFDPCPDFTQSNPSFDQTSGFEIPKSVKNGNDPERI